MKLDLRRNWIYAATIVLALALLSVGSAYLAVAVDRSYIESPENLVLTDFSVNVNQMANTITVSGTGKVSGSPNLAIVTFGVVTESATASEAMRLNAETMNQVVEALKNAGISEDQIETVSFGVHPIYDHTKETPMITGYRVSNQVRVEIYDLTRVGELIDTAGEAGANQIYGVTFTITDEEAKELRNQALAKAIEDANIKVEVISLGLGLNITGVVHVSESSYYQPIYTDYEGMVKAPASTPIFQGDVDMVATVQVIYAYS